MPVLARMTGALPGSGEVHLTEAVEGSGGPLHGELAGSHGVRMPVGLGCNTEAVVALGEAFWMCGTRHREAASFNVSAPA